MFDIEDDEFAIYTLLFAPLEEVFGPLDDHVLSAPVPFCVGGAVSLCMREAHGLYVTFDLVRERGQTPSAEGLRYELFVEGAAGDAEAGALLDALAQHFFEVPLADGMEVALADLGLEGAGDARVRLTKFSEAPKGFGLYEVSSL